MNSMQNPMMNGMQNPMMNGMQNPVMNGMQNPMMNGMQNPMMNGMQHSMMNGMQNPMMNGMQNPMMNGMGSSYGRYPWRRQRPFWGRQVGMSNYGEYGMGRYGGGLGLFGRRRRGLFNYGYGGVPPPMGGAYGPRRGLFGRRYGGMPNDYEDGYNRSVAGYGRRRRLFRPRYRRTGRYGAGSMGSEEGIDGPYGRRRRGIFNRRCNCQRSMGRYGRGYGMTGGSSEYMRRPRGCRSRFALNRLFRPDPYKTYVRSLEYYSPHRHSLFKRRGAKRVRYALPNDADAMMYQPQYGMPTSRGVGSQYIDNKRTVLQTSPIDAQRAAVQPAAVPNNGPLGYNSLAPPAACAQNHPVPTIAIIGALPEKSSRRSRSRSASRSHTSSPRKCKKEKKEKSKKSQPCPAAKVVSERRPALTMKDIFPEKSGQSCSGKSPVCHREAHVVALRPIGGAPHEVHVACKAKKRNSFMARLRRMFR